MIIIVFVIVVVIIIIIINWNELAIDIYLDPVKWALMKSKKIWSLKFDWSEIF